MNIWTWTPTNKYMTGFCLLHRKKGGVANLKQDILEAAKLSRNDLESLSVDEAIEEILRILGHDPWLSVGPWGILCTYSYTFVCKCRYNDIHNIMVPKSKHT